MPLSLASQLADHSSTNVTGDFYGTANENELAKAHDTYSWIGLKIAYRLMVSQAIG